MREAILRRDMTLNNYGTRQRGERWVVTSSAIDMFPHLMLKQRFLQKSEFEPGINVIRLPDQGGDCRVLIYNGLGTGFGDLICGSVFVRALYNWLAAKGWTPKIRLVTVPAPPLEMRYREIFGRDPHINGLRSGGIPYAEFAGAHIVLSNEALVADDAFDRVDMVEYFFHRGGLSRNPDSRIPEIYPDMAEFERGARYVAGFPGKRLFVNFCGSGMRRVSCMLWQKILDPVVRDKWTVLLSSPPDGHRALSAFIGARYRNKQVHAIGEASTSWSAHVGMVAACDATLCTDTSTTHVAAAVRRPCVTMFQFIDPALRIKHYPLARGWCPDVFRSGPHWGRSHPYPGWADERHDEDPEIVKPWKKTDLAGPARLLREFLN